MQLWLTDLRIAVSGADTVLDKPYSDPKQTAFVDYFGSGKPNKVVKGLNLLTLYYSDPKGSSVPVNYRLSDKEDGKLSMVLG